MRSLKRIITMLLALTMLITSVGITALADTQFSDITDQRVEKAVDKLVAFGIINGYEDGTFRPDNQITRAEFAAIVTRMKGVADSLPQDAVTGFADLDNDPTRAWARPYVKAAVDLKIINGFEDGTFRAGEPVTYEQAVKMLVCAAGYEVVAQSEYRKLQAISPNTVTWSSGYIAAANKHGFTLGAVTGQITQPASRGIVAILTSNTVEVPPLQENEDGTLEKPSEGETQTNNITISGTVVGTHYTGLDTDDTGLLEKEIIIYNAEKGEETYTLSTSFAKTIDLDSFIGKKVDAYYDNLEGEITSMKLRSTESTKIDESAVTDIDGTTIKYATSGTNTKTQSLAGYTYIVNGKYVDSFDFENDFDNGTIELFTAATADGVVDVAKITSYTLFVVSSFDKTNEKIFLKYGETYDGNTYYTFPRRSVDKPKIYVNGRLTEFDSLSLSQYDVINFMEAPTDVAGPTFSRMYVTKGSKTGKVTKQIGDGTGRKVVLDNKTMYLTNQYNEFAGTAADEKAPFELSETYTYYLDYTGQIAAVNYNSSAQTGNWAYGYLVLAGEDDNGNPAVKIFTSSGDMPVYRLKDTVKFDGEKKKADTVIGLLEDIAVDLITENADVVTGTVGNNYAQPIRYSLSSGKIESIDTVLEEEGGTGDAFTFDGVVTGLESTSTTRVTSGGETFSVDSSTLVFFVPKNRESEKEYAVMKPSSAFAVTASRYVDVFAVDNNNTAKVVVVYGTNPTFNFIASSPYMLVKEKISGGESFLGYVNAAENATEVVVSEDNFETVIGEEEYLVEPDDVDEGDIIRYIKNNKGEIIAIQMVYDASAGGDLTSGDEFADGEGSGDFVARYGVVELIGAVDKTIDINCDGTTKTYKTTNTKFLKVTEDGLTTTVLEDVKVTNLHGTSSTVIVITNATTDNAAARVLYILD